MFAAAGSGSIFGPPIGLISTTIAVETVDVDGTPLATTGTTVTIADTTVTSSNSPSVGSITIQTGGPYNAPLSVSPAPGYIVSRIAAVHNTTMTDLTDTFPVLGSEMLRIFLSCEPAAGEKRFPATCWDDSIIYAEVYDATLHRWVPSGETCPPKPECTEGDKKAGYVCVGGKWVPTVFGSYDLKRRDDERNIWYFPPLTLQAVNNTGERAYIEIGIWLDGVYKKYYDQPLSPTGQVTFEINNYLKAGSYSNSLYIGEGTHIIETPDRKKKMEITVWDPGREGELRSSVMCWDGSMIFKEVYRSGKWVPTGETCPPEPAAGEKRFPATCWDDSIIHAEVYDATLHRWVPSGETCPVKVCTEGEKRNPETCWDGSVINKEVCRNNSWVPSGETCPSKPECTEGDKKAGYVCVGGKWQTAPAVPEPVIEPKPECTEGDRRYPIMCMVRDEFGVMRPSGSICMEVCRNNAWVPSGETCPSKPECTEGDKKAGYVCVAGKWQTAPAVPEPVPEPVPPADEMFTIEFQELIPGITPPRVPLLIPGLESLPLLPGWIVRDAAGNIVNKGAELPTLPGIQNY